MHTLLNNNLKISILQTLKHGECNALTGKNLATILGEKGTRQIRLAIVELRHELHPIIGGQKGYFIAETIDELKNAENFLRSYIIDLQHDLNDYEAIEEKFAGQLKLKL